MFCFEESMIHFRTSDICKSFKSPAPLVKTYSMAYRWYRFHRSLNPHHEDYQDYEEIKYGEIFRDDVAGRFFRRHGEECELYVKEDNGVFSKVNHLYDYLIALPMDKLVSTHRTYFTSNIFLSNTEIEIL